MRGKQACNCSNTYDAELFKCFRETVVFLKMCNKLKGKEQNKGNLQKLGGMFFLLPQAQDRVLKPLNIPSIKHIESPG